jgi:hypothetical protein
MTEWELRKQIEDDLDLAAMERLNLTLELYSTGITKISPADLLAYQAMPSRRKREALMSYLHYEAAGYTSPGFHQERRT